MTDIVWRANGYWVTFYPVSESGKKVWIELHSKGLEKCPEPQAVQVIDGLKRAGYTVRKQRASKINDDVLLKQLQE